MPPREPAVLEIPIPDPGPRTLGAGWSTSWRGFVAQLRRPLSLLPVTLGTIVVFSLIQMALLYGVNITLYGTEIPTDQRAQFINTGLWQIFAYLVGPASITPWFAARTLFASRLRAPWRLVKEPFGAPWRWAHLLLLGTAWMVLAGATGATLSTFRESMNGWVMLAVGVSMWMVTQVVFSTAAASVWRDGSSWYQALWDGVSRSVRSILPVIGMGLAWMTQLVVVGGFLVITIGLPLTIIDMSFEQFSLVSLVALPIALIAISFIYHQRAILGLAVLDWGSPGWRRKFLVPEASPEDVSGTAPTEEGTPQS